MDRIFASGHRIVINSEWALFSGRAWGVLPAQYDKKREGGSNVVGEWKREWFTEIKFFRKFKGVDQKDEDKKLWQFIGKGATTPDDYYSWSDYLKYLRASDQFVLVKRTDGQITYLPASKEGDYLEIISRNLF